ncbi:MAG: hypothetical protein ABSD72_18785 [Terracidiphilus sp.]|jgi:hypothetical protein
MKLGVPVFEGGDLLDVAGPYEMFKWVDPKKALETVILSEDGGPVTSGNGVRFEAHSSFAANLITYETVKRWKASGKPAKHAFFGIGDVNFHSERPSDPHVPSEIQTKSQLSW